MSKISHQLETLFSSAVQAVQAENCLPSHLPAPPAGKTLVMGAGKAAAAMARCVEQHWSGPLSGLVVTRYGHGVPCDQIEVVEAAHPVPDDVGQHTAERMLALARDLGPEDLALCLVSGGGSALLSLPATGLTLADKQSVNKALLRSGANIQEMNCVRKHLSRIKGGRLAMACAPAAVCGLIISDVPGDDPGVVASGPTVGDTTTLQQARDILDRYQIQVPDPVSAYLNDPTHETPKPGDAIFKNTHNVVIARAHDALDAAATKAQEFGLQPIVLGDDLEGEAREVGAQHAALLSDLRQQYSGSFVVLSGGETTVTVRGEGRGGRNVEYLLGLALALNGQADVYALAADTDGIDGTEDNAGALITPDTLRRATALGLEPAAMLADNDAYSLFKRLGDLLLTGPTLTNVNDFRAIAVVR